MLDVYFRWVSVEDGATSAVVPRVNYPLPMSRLVSLASDYSELINDTSLFTCPKSEGDDSRTPAMCLVCGDVLCSQVILTNKPYKSVLQEHSIQLKRQFNK